MPKPCPLTRREFVLSVCSLPFCSFPSLAEEFASMPWNGPATVAKVYLAAPNVHWPKPTLDVAAEVAEIEARLADVERKNSANVRFTGGQVLRTEQDVAPWLAQTGDADAVLMVPVSQPTPPLRPLVDGLRVPGLFFSRPYATHAWASIAALRKSGKKLDVVATSSYGDLGSPSPAGSWFQPPR